MKQTPKRLLAALLLTAMLTALPACRGGTGQGTQTSDAATTAPAANAEITDEPITGMNRVDATSPLQYADGHLYFEARGLGMLYRYNVRTGNLTAVCPDPLCAHKDLECLIYGLHDFVLYENDIYFYRYNFFLPDFKKLDLPEEEFVGYDIESAKLKKLESYEDGKHSKIVLELYTDGYRFFYDVIEDEETGERRYAFCRMDLENGKVTVLEEDSEYVDGDFVSDIQFALNGRLYFLIGTELYSTDCDLQDRQTVLTRELMPTTFYTDGEYIFWGERMPDSGDPFTVYRAKVDGSEVTPLGIETYSFTVTQNHIYYKNTEKVVVAEDKLSASIAEYITITGTELYRVDHDGKGKETVFRYQQGDTTYSLSSACYVNDTIYAYYTTYRDADGDGAIRDDEEFASINSQENRLIRIDMTTGEISYISVGDAS